MRGYIGRLAAIYVIISVSMILSLFPIYNTIETWQETNISKVLNPECSLCELRQLYLEQGASGFSQYLETRQQKYNSESSTFNLMHYQEVIASLFKEENSYAY